MTVWEALVLGAVQGLTEFIPVSSSGHLVLVQKIMHIDSGQLLGFDAVLHLGTLFALVIVMGKPLMGVIQPFLGARGSATDPEAQAAPTSGVNLLNVVLATGATGVVYLLFKHFLEESFESNFYLAIGFVLTAALLAAGEWLGAKAEKRGVASSVTPLGAWVIGTFQGFSIMASLSRSGATIAAAQAMGIRREPAVGFSMVILFPATLAALVVTHGFDPNVLLTAQGLAGLVSSFIFGYWSLKWLLYLSRKGTLLVFAAYTFLLGAGIWLVLR